MRAPFVSRMHPRPRSLWRRAAPWRWLVGSAALVSTLAFFGRPQGPPPFVVPPAQFTPTPQSPSVTLTLTPTRAPAQPPAPAPRDVNLSDRLDVDSLTPAGRPRGSYAPPARSRAVWSASGRGRMGGTISGSGLTAEYCCAGASSRTLADTALTAGRHYWEVTLATTADGPDTWTNVGVTATGQSDPYPAGANLPSAGGQNQRGAWIMSRADRYRDGDVFTIAFDAGRRTAYFGANGVWLNGDPDTEVGGATIGNPGDTFVAAVEISASSDRTVGDRWTANFGARPFQYPIPLGYSAYGTAASSAAERPPLATVAGDITLGGRRILLLDGEWIELVKFVDESAGRTAAIFGRAADSRIVEVIAVDAGGSPASYPAFAACDRTDYAAKDVVSNEASGAQRCWWINHAVDVWRDQAAFRLAREAAEAQSLAVPDAMINVSFRSADRDGYTTVHYYFDPSQKGIDTARTSWTLSSWHRDRLAADARRQEYIDERSDWARTWAQLVYASR